LNEAYYFLSDNRKLLLLPPYQEIRVVDLYGNNKFSAAAERLPREVVLEYAWQEEVILANDLKNNLDFSQWNGKSTNLDCGGTLVFDDRGNLMSWFRKPGTNHISAEEVQNLLARGAAWESDPHTAMEKRVKRLTILEKAELADLEVGRQRKASLLGYLSALIQRGLVGTPQQEIPFGDITKPVVAYDVGGTIRFEIPPHLRHIDFDLVGGHNEQ
jgi:hypothetical protein